MREEEIMIGKTYFCRRSDGEAAHPATVLKRRSDGDLYVHYVDLDRRLDEWVAESRLEEEVFIPTSKEKKRKLSGHTGIREEDSDGKKRGKSEYAHFHEMTKVRNINKVQLGKHEIDCWYFSPYPGRFGKREKLYICEITFKYFDQKTAYERHLQKAPKEPPGKRIYHDPDRSLCVYQIDGSKDVLFGQSLCLFGKLFIEHKTLSFDSSPFDFFVLYESDAEGLHPVGYFSKEKESKEDYNLACIVALPPYQRKGYGKFIISLSYEVTKRRKEIGSPEKPLSDLGKISYRSYWTYVLLEYLDGVSDQDMNDLTLEKLAYALGIKPDDIISTLHSIGMIFHLKGQLVVKVNRPQVKALLEPYKERNFAKSFCKPELLSL